MAQDRAKLKRLTRMERVRTVARQNAMEIAAEAENHYARLSALEQRSRKLAESCQSHAHSQYAHSLRDMRAYYNALAELHQMAVRDCEQARINADNRQFDFARADKSRELVRQALSDGRRILARGKG